MTDGEALEQNVPGCTGEARDVPERTLAQLNALAPHMDETKFVGCVNFAACNRLCQGVNGN